MGVAIVGMERVAVLIGRCAIYEQLYLTGGVPKNAEEATENLRRGLLALYTAILQALCQLMRVFQGRIYSTIVYFHGWILLEDPSRIPNMRTPHV